MFGVRGGKVDILIYLNICSGTRFTLTLLIICIKTSQFDPESTSLIIVMPIP